MTRARRRDKVSRNATKGACESSRFLKLTATNQGCTRSPSVFCFAKSTFSLRLSHASGLTVHRTVIQHFGVATLPSGDRLAKILLPCGKMVASTFRKKRKNKCLTILPFYDIIITEHINYTALFCARHKKQKGN